jgi:hypothetical protein
MDLYRGGAVYRSFALLNLEDGGGIVEQLCRSTAKNNSVHTKSTRYGRGLAGQRSSP